jgi:hypothetical protein
VEGNKTPSTAHHGHLQFMCFHFSKNSQPLAKLLTCFAHSFLSRDCPNIMLFVDQINRAEKWVIWEGSHSGSIEKLPSGEQ